ncbi:MAG: alternative ribosome rescue factor ArfA [Alphaproteobacteria bacterium]
MKQRNPHARALRDPRFRPRQVKPRKGRGSYSRKARSPKSESGPVRAHARPRQGSSHATSATGPAMGNGAARGSRLRAVRRRILVAATGSHSARRRAQPFSASARPAR